MLDLKTGALLAVLVSAACEATPVGKERSRLVRIRFQAAGANVTFACDHNVRLACTNPRGGACEADGDVGAGGTVRGLCESLRSSLAARGVKATYHDTDRNGNELARAMDQTVELPDDWVAVAPVAVVAYGSATELVVTLL
jgi:hypothetical protein